MPRPCANCGKIGHGRKTCPKPFQDLVDAGKPAKTPKRKATKKAARPPKRPRTARTKAKPAGPLSDARAAIESRRSSLVAQVARLDDVLQALDEVAFSR